MAGPERPRWVNSMASLKRVPSSAVTATGRLTPARSAKASLVGLMQGKGTSPARVGSTGEAELLPPA